MVESEYKQYVDDSLNVFAFSSQAKGFFAILEHGGVDAMPDTTKEIYLNERNLRRYQKLRALADQRNESIPTLVLAALISDPNINAFAQIGPQNIKELSASLMGADVSLLETERRFLLEDWKVQKTMNLSQCTKKALGAVFSNQIHSIARGWQKGPQP